MANRILVRLTLPNSVQDARKKASRLSFLPVFPPRTGRLPEARQSKRTSEVGDGARWCGQIVDWTRWALTHSAGKSILF